MINSRLTRFREAMTENRLDAYIVPSSDPHQSEYVSDHWKCREWISGFDGSAGIAVITKEHAGIWTDSRYFIQAESQLKKSEFILHKVLNQEFPSHIQWLCEQLVPASVVGINGSLFSQAQYESMKQKFDQFNIQLCTDVDIVESCWSDRPSISSHPAFEHKLEYAGRSVQEKLDGIRNQLKNSNSDFHLISTLDDIAWIFNLRGNDVVFNPVVISFALVGLNSTSLFIDERKMSSYFHNKFSELNINILPYDQIENALYKIPKEKTILIDKADCNHKLYSVIGCQINSGKNIPRAQKAIKNKTEIAHIRKVMVKDGVALTKMYMWLERNIDKTKITEADIADKLALYRSQQDLYKGESFSAIVGYNANGAIVHYRPVHGSSATIHREGILLIDSGGQYLDGTTDITRTIALSPPTNEQKQSYTAVLKGHIELDCAQYPEGTIGCQLDILARKPLWSMGLNYLHGTGHGVGFFLNVHEPPQGFTAGISSRGNAKLLPGMLTSNEPGYYKEGEYGIRIENLILTTKSKHKGFLKHETLTLFPIDLSLIDKTMLTSSEIHWINMYHKDVFKKLLPKLNSDEVIWLKEKCSEL